MKSNSRIFPDLLISTLSFSSFPFGTSVCGTFGISDNILSSIPNIPHQDVPNGKDENDNVEVLKAGKIPEFDFKPKSHYELGENLGMLDFDLATKTTGSRFVFVKKELALLERALSNFMLDTHIIQNGYQEISPPLSI